MKKLCCILALIVLLLNSSFMIVISEAVNTITNNFLTEQKETLEEKKEDIEVINEANIYNGYMIANLTNPENKYETKYTDILGLEINNKATIQEIMIKETNKFVNEEKIEEANTSETQTKKEEIENNNILMYESTKVNKKSIFDVLKSNGTIEIIDENEEILKTINKDTETDEDGNINITYENKLKELTIKIKNIEKEGNINFVNTKVIDASFNNLDCKVKTETTIEGKNIRNKVTYENTKENILDIKDAYSEIDANLDVENLVNNVSNNTVLTLTLKTNEAKYSLFRNPTISIEMPEECTIRTTFINV